jgi:bacteriocin biosynthesis cyclodehydratase domain-containing protein
VRLKRTVEPFVAANRTLYLLRGGAEAAYAMREPAPAVLELMRALEEDAPRTPRELAARLAAAGHDVPLADVEQALGELADAGLLESDGPALLAPHDRDRYGRQMLYFGDLAGDGRDAHAMQARLMDASVALVGAGGLGSSVAGYLAAAGVRTLVAIDGDRVERSNLNRQTLFAEADLGRLKVDALVDAIARFNAGVRVRPVPEYVHGADALAPLLDGVDVVVCAADLPAYQIGRWVNAACWERGIPWITGGQFPPHLRVGPLYVPGRTACLDCLEAAARRDFPLYDELAAYREAHPKPSATLGATSGWIAAGIAMNLIQHLSGAAEAPACGRSHLLDLRSFALEVSEVRPWPGCPTCGGVAVSREPATSAA